MDRANIQYLTFVWYDKLHNWHKSHIVGEKIDDEHKGMWIFYIIVHSILYKYLSRYACIYTYTTVHVFFTAISEARNDLQLFYISTLLWISSNKQTNSHFSFNFRFFNSSFTSNSKRWIAFSTSIIVKPMCSSASDPVWGWSAIKHKLTRVLSRIKASVGFFELIRSRANQFQTSFSTLNSNSNLVSVFNFQF